MQRRQDLIELHLVLSDEVRQLQDRVTACAERRRELVATVGQQVEDLFALVDERDQRLVLVGQCLAQGVGVVDQLAQLRVA